MPRSCTTCPREHDLTCGMASSRSDSPVSGMGPLVGPLGQNVAIPSGGDVALGILGMEESLFDELMRRLLDLADEPRVIPVPFLQRPAWIARCAPIRSRSG